VEIRGIVLLAAGPYSTFALARRLFARFNERIDSLTLMPVAEDEFALSLNSALVRSQRESGEAPRVADVLCHVL
jgi:hypothetical protein